jgi:thiol:disulfide interchange protein DsbD
MYNYLLVFTLLFNGAAFSQNPDKPVSWKLSQEEDSVKACASISEGWHMYALELPSDEGPIPTEIKYNEEEVNHKNWKYPTYHESYDPNFDVEVYYYEGEVCFTHLNKKEKVEVMVYYMVCNDEMCMPPNEEVLRIEDEK